MRFLLVFLHFKRLLGISTKRQRNLANVAHENKNCLLGVNIALDFTLTSERMEILNYAATYGQNKKIINQLTHCFELLNEVVQPLHLMGNPVILSPMHMVSDILSGIVASNVYPGKGTIIVSSSAESYEEKDRVRGGINLSYCSIHKNSEGIAKNLMSACIDATEHRTNIIIFPDIVPEYTYTSGAISSSKMNCTLFGRPANIHSGVYKIAKMLSAKVVFFYLYYDEGIKIHINEPLNSNDIHAELPKLIESAITQHPQDWLLWHLHSLYFINN